MKTKNLSNQKADLARVLWFCFYSEADFEAFDRDLQGDLFDDVNHQEEQVNTFIQEEPEYIVKPEGQYEVRNAQYAEEANKNEPQTVQLPQVDVQVEESIHPSTSVKRHGLFEIGHPNALLAEVPDEPLEDLFHEMWYKEQLCILFGDNGIGKSMLTHQIAVAIAETHPSEGVSLIDCELSKRQWKNRYKNKITGEMFPWPPNFELQLIEPGGEMGDLDIITAKKSLENQVRDKVEESLANNQRDFPLRFLFIDNLSALLFDKENTNAATELMTWLNTLKKKFHVTILIVAHPPKIDRTLPMNKDMLAGSKQLSNLCDALIGMNSVYNANTESYVKLLKNRDAEELSFNKDTEVFKYNCTRRNGYVYLEDKGLVYELDCLPRGNAFARVQEASEERIEETLKIAALKKAGLTYAEIEKETGIKHSKACNMINQGLIKGIITKSDVTPDKAD